jgi:hypothetical protein
MLRRSLLIFLVLASKANAIDRAVVPCDEAGIGLTSLVTPVGDNSRQFYNGQVSVYLVDTIEPACCSAGVAIVLPDAESELGDSKCFAVLYQSTIDLKAARANYSPANGLLIEMPAKEQDDAGNQISKPLKLRVNLKSSAATLEE